MRPDQIPTDFEVIRRMPDGLWEVKDWQNRRRRVRLHDCSVCEIRLPDYYFGTYQIDRKALTMCPVCSREYGFHVKVRERVEHYQRRKAASDLPYQRRAIALALATPAWRDRAAIKAIYEQARRLTRETGIVHHVDHYYPLQGDLCCGLHVHQNLRILTATENCSKHKKHPLDQSPTLFLGD